MSKGTPIKTAIANWEAANEGQKAAESEKVHAHISLQLQNNEQFDALPK
jgi:hypothetical protein